MLKPKNGGFWLHNLCALILAIEFMWSRTNYLIALTQSELNMVELQGFQFVECGNVVCVVSLLSLRNVFQSFHNSYSG